MWGGGGGQQYPKVYIAVAEHTWGTHKFENTATGNPSHAHPEFFSPQYLNPQGSILSAAARPQLGEIMRFMGGEGGNGVTCVCAHFSHPDNTVRRRCPQGGWRNRLPFSSWGKVHLSYGEKKEKKFSCFPYFCQVYFFRHFSSNKISFPTHGIANSGDRKAKEKLNYGPSFCTMPQKVGEEDVCIG